MYTIICPVSGQGISINPAHLASLDIENGSRCWALWNDASSLPEGTSLIEPRQSMVNQAPHLTISPIHTDLWATSFELVVLIERKRADKLHDPESSDSIQGLSDALDRCGVNILFIQTAQLGYSVVAVTATCELPSLQNAARELVIRADQEGERLADARYTKTNLQLRTKTELEVSQSRAKGLASLSSLIVPQMAQLEARLCLIDNARFEINPYTNRNRNVDLLAMQKAKILSGSDDDGRESVSESIRQPWFFSSKVVEVGENPYFKCPPEFLTNKEIDDMVSEGEKLIGSAHPRVLSETRRNEVFERARVVLSNRPVRSPWDAVIAAVGNTKHSRSGAAMRADLSKNGADLQKAMIAKVFERQMYYPVRTRANSSLAHARFHALPTPFGSASRGSSPKLMVQPFAFDCKYPAKDGNSHPDVMLLGPGTESKAGEFKPDPDLLVGSLNHYTGLIGVSDESRFKLDQSNPDTGLVTINPNERFLRIRFCRESVAQSAMRKIVIGYSIHRPTTNSGERSRGFLREVSYCLCSPASPFWTSLRTNLKDSDTSNDRTAPLAGVRIESVRNTIHRLGPDHERGCVTLVVNAMCQRSASLLSDSSNASTCLKESLTASSVSVQDDSKSDEFSVRIETIGVDV